jgi:metal-dependent amidase/aminoacylase/carboxypeptidase family protein
MNINAQRETFRDDGTIRVRQIVTRDGDLVHIVPDDVRMEIFVRGKSVESIQDASGKINRSLEAAALALGGEVEIQTVPGYLPRLKEEAMAGVLAKDFAALIGKALVEVDSHGTGSSDTGDLSYLMPLVEVKCGGFQRGLHTNSFAIADEEQAYIVPAMAMTTIDLLAEAAQAARAILAGFTRRMSKAENLSYLRSVK